MKVLFAAALLSVIEAAELESYHTRHARLARAGIHGYYGYGVPTAGPSIPAPYNTNRSGYFADHSDRSDDDSTN